MAGNRRKESSCVYVNAGRQALIRKTKNTSVAQVIISVMKKDFETDAVRLIILTRRMVTPNYQYIHTFPGD